MLASMLTFMLTSILTSMLTSMLTPMLHNAGVITPRPITVINVLYLLHPWQVFSHKFWVKRSKQVAIELQKKTQFKKQAKGVVYKVKQAAPLGRRPKAIKRKHPLQRTGVGVEAMVTMRQAGKKKLGRGGRLLAPVQCPGNVETYCLV